jgi:hypothetical protein
MSVFDEQQFYSDFMDYYNENSDDISDNHEISFVFDWYFELHIFNTDKYNQWFKHFFPTHTETDEDLIYDKLFNIIKDNNEQSFLSEEDTDEE